METTQTQKKKKKRKKRHGKDSNDQLKYIRNCKGKITTTAITRTKEQHNTETARKVDTGNDLRDTAETVSRKQRQQQNTEKKKKIQVDEWRQHQAALTAS